MNNRDIAALTDKYVARTYARTPIALVRGQGHQGLGRRRQRVSRFPGRNRGQQPGSLPSGDRPGDPAASRRSCCTSPISITFSRSRSWRASCAAIRLPIGLSFATAAPRPTRRRSNWRAATVWRSWAVSTKSLSTHNSFHGRTLATLTATGQEKIRAGYDPLPAGFRQVPYNDLGAIEEAIDEKKTVGDIGRADSGRGRRQSSPDEIYMRGLARALRPARHVADLR